MLCVKAQYPVYIHSSRDRQTGADWLITYSIAFDSHPAVNAVCSHDEFLLMSTHL